MKRLIILILILPLNLLADVNFNKFGSVFKNPVKWMSTMPINQITLDELIMNLGTPDQSFENEGKKYLFYQWGTTISGITFFIEDNKIYDALYDPNGATKSVKDGGMASINMKIMDGAAGLLGFDISSGKKTLLSDLKK